MEISTNDDLNALYDLLEVLVNLGITGEIDRIVHNIDNSRVHVTYITHGELLYES